MCLSNQVILKFFVTFHSKVYGPLDINSTCVCLTMSTHAATRTTVTLMMSFFFSSRCWNLYSTSKLPTLILSDYSPQSEFQFIPKATKLKTYYCLKYQCMTDFGYFSVHPHFYCIICLCES